MPFDSLGTFLDALEQAGKLHTISGRVDGAWEVAALTRRVFQRLPADRRPALLFEDVDGKGALVVGVLGASRAVYALGIGVEESQIAERWQAAIQHPLPPREVSRGPVQEQVFTGAEVDIRRFPHPVWTPGEDPGPYISGGYLVSRDPDTGQINIGIYRMEVKSANNCGLFISQGQHLDRHIRKNEARGRSTPVAVVIGAAPIIGQVAGSKLPYTADEYAVAGALQGAPVDVVRCQTCDLVVPAGAEIVLEGEVVAGERQHEGPFGEYTGYMGGSGAAYVFRVTAVTCRKRPIYQGILDEMPPSEGSCMKNIGREWPLLHHLQKVMGLPVTRLSFTEGGASTAWLVIAMKKEYPTQVQEVLWAAWSAIQGRGKYTIIVDDDIDPTDSAQVEWAISYHSQPEQDVHIYRKTPAVGLDPSTAHAEVPLDHPSRWTASKCFIDATRKHKYPPVALPPAEHLAEIDRRWRRYGLPD